MNLFGRTMLAMGLCATPLAAQDCDPADVFGEPVSAVSDGNREIVVLGDFNEDGVLDLIGEGAGSATIELGNGDGAFQDATEVDDFFVGAGADVLQAADLNGDGNLDVIASSGAQQRLAFYVLLGQGDGTFIVLPEQIAANMGSAYGQFDLADINDDEILDLVTVSDARLYTLLGNGDGTFGSTVEYFGVSGTFGVTAGDLNGDGLADVAVHQFDPYQLKVYLNRPDSPGILSDADDYDLPAAFFNQSDLVDLNADGALDLVIANSTIGGPTVYLGNGDGTLQPFTSYPGATPASGLTIADVNGDSHLDFANNNNNNNLRVFYGVGDGSFGAVIDYLPIGAGEPTMAQAGDIDLDGDIDVLFKGVDNITPVINVYFNDCTVAPQIVSQPEPLTLVDAGADVTLSVDIGIGTPPISFQWRRNGVNMTDGGHISGATTDTLMLADVTFADTDTYDVVVSNDIGMVMSASAVVGVRQSCYPDCNGDGVLNILDFVCFQGQFQAACP